MTDKILIDRALLQHALEALTYKGYSPHKKRVPAIKALRKALAAPDANPWREAVEDELTVAHILNETHSEPVKAVKDAIDWNVQVALDPAVSRAALDLIERGKALAAPQPTQPAQPVAWMVMNGVCNYQLCGSKKQADALCAEMQKRHDLSGSLSTFHVQPLYLAPQPQPAQPADIPKIGCVNHDCDKCKAVQPCPTCVSLARTVMLDQVSFDRKPDCYGIRQITDDEGVEEWEDIRTSPDVAREEANDMMATGRGEIYEVVPLWTTPQPAPGGDMLYLTPQPQPAQPADIPKIGCVNHDCDRCKAVAQEPAEHWPTNAEQVRQFVGSNFCSLEYASDDHAPHENDRYTVSAHDLLSAIADWQDFVLEQEPQPAEPVSMSKKSQTEHELEAMNRYIQKITKDKSSATAFLSRAGILDPNGELAAQYRDVEYKMRADRSEQPAQEPAEPSSWIDAVMEQAQSFASAWSLVGGPFDDGTGLDVAEEEKNGLRAMLYTPQPQRQPLTVAEVESIIASHNYEVHGDRARYIVRMTEQAHGITGEDK